jgi:hypothetical protein
VLLWEAFRIHFLMAFYILDHLDSLDTGLDRAIVLYIHCNCQRLPTFSFVHEHTFVNSSFFLDLVVE